jgi:hypothetical protein
MAGLRREHNDGPEGRGHEPGVLRDQAAGYQQGKGPPKRPLFIQAVRDAFIAITTP